MAKKRSCCRRVFSLASFWSTHQYQETPQCCFSFYQFWFHFRQTTEKLNTVLFLTRIQSGFILVDSPIALFRGKGPVIDAYSIWFHSGRLTKTRKLSFYHFGFHF
ncbi:uncharacterized protein LOC110045354 [Orbicella faveolata]|uniref:uncharacterized protein LOC110045354 n=1 Tax=Orbicella faveolata TaxID=48498 RepID=UPI0009E4D93C|nr:uncharacterized protein LOC110045354 [Orbicella faveolata]